MKSKNFTWIDKNIEKYNFQNKNVFITGGNSGIGFELAKQCAYLKANLFLLCRNIKKAEDAKLNILNEFPNTKISIIECDLASLKSIEKATEEIKKFDVDFFVNNAGVYRLPKGTKTNENLEIIMGTNFIGTYYLNSLLFPYFSSLNHKVKILFETSITSKFKKIKYNEFSEDFPYKPFKLYAKSKLGVNCIFDYFVEKNAAYLSFSLAHPGATYTPLINKGYKNKIFRLAAKGFMKVFFHSPSKASLCLLKGLDIEANNKIGPRGLFEISGYPHLWKIREYKKTAEVIAFADQILKDKLN